MQRVTRKTYDVCVDGTYWRLCSLAEWEAFMSLEATAGVVWRDGDRGKDAIRHRLLQEQEQEVTP